MSEPHFDIAERGVLKNGSCVCDGQVLDHHVSRPDVADADALTRVGKRPVLKRNFGFMASLGLTCSLLITWEVTLFGGPAGVIYGYILVWVGATSVFSTLAEMASMYVRIRYYSKILLIVKRAPVASGQYHWVAMLAPKSSQRFLSYITGWFTVVGWQAQVASAAYLTGFGIQGLVVLTNLKYTPQAWHTTFILWTDVIFGVFINTVVSSALPKFEGFILIVHIVGFFAVIIPLVLLGPHDSPANVFTVFVNGGNWPTNGISFFVGIIGNAVSFFGADGAVHMIEEIRHAPVVVPRSIVSAITMNGILGFAMTVAILFCIGNVDAALDTSTQFPFIEIFSQAVQSVAGAALMASLVVAMGICATTAMIASASRILWSFARDRAVPGWTFVATLDKRTTIPLNAVAITTVIPCLLALILIGSLTAFNDVLSLTLSALYSSYLLTTGLLLWRRCRGDISPASQPGTSLANVPDYPLIWGPWRIPGILGIINNAFACAYLTVMLVFSFWPPATPVTPSTMNYSSLMLGATLIFSVLYYFVRAHRDYLGPVVEKEKGEVR